MFSRAGNLPSATMITQYEPIERKIEEINHSDTLLNLHF